MEAIVASGPVIVENGKLLVNRDKSDEFFKLPGRKIREGESAEECCIRETKEEINGEVKILRPLSHMVLWKKPQSGENILVVLIHYLARIKNRDLKPGKGIVEIKWLDVNEIKKGKHNVGPNIKFLIEKGDIK